MQPVIATEPIRDTRGDDWIWPIRLSGQDSQPIDLTGCEFDGAEIKWFGGVIPLTTDNGRLAVEPEAGEVTVQVDRSDTAAVPPGQQARLVLPIIDSLERRSTLLIIRIAIREP